MVETSSAAVDLLLQPLAQEVADVVRVDLLRPGAVHHLLVDRPVLGREELLVGDVGIGGIDALLLRVVERVDDHVVVEHLRLGGAVDGVQLVLAFGVGVGPDLVEPLPVLVAHQDDGGDDDDDGDDGGERRDESDASTVHVLFLVHLHDGAVRENLAGLSGVSRQTLALEVVLQVDAEPVVHARRGVALVDFDGAILAGESWLAGADKVVDGVVAGASVLAGVAAAVVDVLFAVGSDEARSAVALVVGDEIDAGAAVLAGVDLAVVDVVVAVLAGETDGATALVVSSVGGEGAGGSVGTGGRPAGVDFNVAIDTLETLGALADVARGAPGAVDALGSVLAGLVVAGLSPHLAVVAVKADGADAGVVADAGPLGEEERKVCFIFCCSCSRNLVMNVLTMKSAKKNWCRENERLPPSDS